MEIDGNSSFSNIANAHRAVESATARISSGLRINNAQDDAAGLAISNGMSAEIRGYTQAVRNANDGISMLQTAGGSLEGVTDSFQRINELAMQASNGTLNPSDREALDAEAQQLMQEVSRIIDTTTFNGQPLLKGEQELSLQLGGDAQDQLSLSNNDLSQQLEELGFYDIDLSSSAGASSALSVLDQAQEYSAAANANIGAETNRLQSSINSISLATSATAESRSRISDADMAKEISQRVNNQVKVDASLSVLAMNNANKGNVLKLLNF